MTANLFDLTVGGSTMFSVDSSGQATAVSWGVSGSGNGQFYAFATNAEPTDCVNLSGAQTCFVIGDAVINGGGLSVSANNPTTGSQNPFLPVPVGSGTFTLDDCLKVGQVNSATKQLLFADAGAPCGSGSMVYPGAGIPVSTGSAWGTSLAETDGDFIAGISGAWTKTTALPSGATATTQSQYDNSTKVATTAYVDTAVGAPTAAPTFVQYAYNQPASTGTTSAATFSNSTPAGNFLLVWTDNDTSINITISDNEGNKYHEISQEQVACGGFGDRHRAFWAINKTTGTITVTVNLGGATTPNDVVFVSEWSGATGIDGSPNFADEVFASGTNPSLTATTLTPNDTVVGIAMACSGSAGQSLNNGSGWTLIYQTNPAGEIGAGFEYKTVASPSTVTATWGYTTTESGLWTINLSSNPTIPSTTENTANNLYYSTDFCSALPSSLSSGGIVAGQWLWTTASGGTLTYGTGDGSHSYDAPNMPCLYTITTGTSSGNGSSIAWGKVPGPGDMVFDLNATFRINTTSNIQASLWINNTTGTGAIGLLYDPNNLNGQGATCETDWCFFTSDGTAVTVDSGVAPVATDMVKVRIRAIKVGEVLISMCQAPNSSSCELGTETSMTTHLPVKVTMQPQFLIVPASSGSVKGSIMHFSFQMPRMK